MFFTGKYSILKKMRYVADQQGILDRYIKETNAWASHLEKTKETIINCASNKKRGSCAILGSGWLLDVPVEFLCQNFETVYLFDVIHPTQVKHKMHKHKNVVLVEQDITGGTINEFYESVQLNKSLKKRKEPNEFSFHGFEYNQAFDYVVSVNILNQLDTLIIDYIEKYGLYNAAEILGFRKSIQQSHIDSLPKGKSCLITDYEELVLTPGGEIEAVNPLIYVNLPQQNTINKWQWQFDHLDYKAGKDVVFNVVALEF